LKHQDDGWERASANHFASRPQSPRKQVGNGLFDTNNNNINNMNTEPPKSALPTFPAFTPIITPPAPQSLLLPPHSHSPSPPKGDKGREVAQQAGQHLSSLQALIGPLVSKLDELERVKQELAVWKASCEAATAEVIHLKAQSAIAPVVSHRSITLSVLICRYLPVQLTLPC
jgi:hypothetical protein